MGDQAHEALVAFYLDDHLNLLAIDLFSDGDPHRVDVPIGRILTRGYQLGCTGLILVHNHPSGDARPSQADIAVTKRICQSAEGMGITLLEHIICAGCEMRRLGFL